MFCVLTLSAQSKLSLKSQNLQRVGDQKFSMFIHFGLYSVYGGVYEEFPLNKDIVSRYCHLQEYSVIGTVQLQMNLIN